MSVPVVPRGHSYRYLVWLAAVAVVLAGAMVAHLVTHGSSAVTNSGSILSGAHGPRKTSATGATGATGAASLSSSPSSSVPLAPDGTFTTLNGRTMTIASLRGEPAMVWLVVNSCSSCFSSVPDVAKHLPQLTSGGLRVVTLGLYGSVPPGKQGLAQISSFGQASISNAGIDMTIPRSDWIWGVASKKLSQTYDPSGTPDVYVLIGPGGHVRYRNSVPIATMPGLLAAAARIHVETTRDAKVAKFAGSTKDDVRVGSGTR